MDSFISLLYSKGVFSLVAVSAQIDGNCVAAHKRAESVNQTLTAVQGNLSVDCAGSLALFLEQVNRLKEVIHLRVKVYQVVLAGANIFRVIKAIKCCGDNRLA